MDSEDEFLGVLFHETGHIYYRHSLKQIMRSAMVGLLISLFFGDVSGITAVLVENSQMLMQMDYSQEAELQADSFALRAMENHSLDKTGLIDFFTKIEERTHMPNYLSALSTHPPTEERIKLIKNSISSSNGNKDLLTNDEWQKIKKKP